MYYDHSSGIINTKYKGEKSVPMFGIGDTVGCGFEPENAKFREDGSLENQQTLQFYFNKNGKKVSLRGIILVVFKNPYSSLILSIKS